MQISFWYSGNEANPPKLGWYFGCRFVAMSEDETGWFYWDGTQWRTNEYYTAGEKISIRFWTDINFDAITTKITNHLMNAATAAALIDAQDAIERYNVVKTLSEN